MIKIGPNYEKLKNSLRLASHRLKILQSKKSETCEKLKVEVADNIKEGKFMRARIKALTIAREDSTVEAMELVEMYCDQILERYELFQEKRVPDDSLLIPVVSVIWVAPYFQSYIEELKVVSKQMAVKYGSRFCRQALTNKCGIVSKELTERVRHFMPTDENIENCLRKICSAHGVEYSKGVGDRFKDLSNASFQQDRSVSGTALKSANGDVEFVATGSREIEDTPVSSKKAFMNIINKSKSKNTERLRRESETSSGENSWKNSTDIVSGVETNNECERKCFKHNEVLKDETRNDNAAVSKFQEIITEKHVLPYNNFDGASDSVRNMYFDPPPPYNYQYLTEYKTEEGIKFEETLDKDFENIQLPSCPKDDPNLT